MDTVLEAALWVDEPIDDRADNLVTELLDERSPISVSSFQPPMTTIGVKDTPLLDNDQNINKCLNSIVYSGPTLGDIENALLVTFGAKVQPANNLLCSRTSMLESGVKKIENKYTLKIKSRGNGMADDGYKWRKYGQKSIKNSPNPRSYYKCTNPRCGAKKQVERSGEDPETLLITYEGLHLHFASPYFLTNQAQLPMPSSKRPKRTPQEEKLQIEEEESEQSQQEAHVAQKSPTSDHPTSSQIGFLELHQEGSVQAGIGSQGLLEDVVPMIVRNPSLSNTSLSSSSSSCSSHPSPPHSPPSLSWSPNYFPLLFDHGIKS
ncbi:WRKY transcription factor [Ancistrocladus abbreviatus]